MAPHDEVFNEQQPLYHMPHAIWSVFHNTQVSSMPPRILQERSQSQTQERAGMFSVCPELTTQVQELLGIDSETLYHVALQISKNCVL